MVRRFFLAFASLLLLTIGLAAAPAAAQDSYPPGPPIAAAIATDGSLLLNTGTFEGNIVVEVGGVVVYSGPADDYSPVSDDAVVGGAVVSITGLDADGNDVTSTTRIPADPATPTPVATATAVPVPTTAPGQPTAIPATAVPTVVAPAPTVVAPAVTATPVFVVSPVAPPVVVTAAARTPAVTRSPALAVTGSSVSLPLVLGTILIASGALAVLASRRRTDVNL